MSSNRNDRLLASQEERVRRLAHRHGLKLTKLRASNPYSDEPHYVVTDPQSSEALLTPEYGTDLEGAEQLIRQRSAK